MSACVVRIQGCWSGTENSGTEVEQHLGVLGTPLGVEQPR